MFVSPREWWKTELWYIGLSLSAKLYLGGFLYGSVLRFASVDAALDPSN